MKDTVKEIFARRLRQARMMRGFSLERLANALSLPVTRQAINKYEKGLMLPDSRVLIALANALNMKVDYFFRPFTVEVDRVEFRKRSTFSKKTAKAVTERVCEELERYLEIEQLTGSEVRFELPIKGINSVKEARAFAHIVRKDLGLGDDGISNVIEVLEERGIKVIEFDETEEFDGLSGYANGHIPLIVVNGTFPAERKRFTALHELGHLLLDISPEVGAKETEGLCNAFASELLLPSDVLISKIGSSRHDISLAELTDIQRQYGISIEDIMDSLHDSGVISDNRYAVFQKKKDRLSDFRALVSQSRFNPEKSGRFSRMVYRALADGLISSSKAAVLLNTSVSTITSTLQLI